MSRYSNGRDHWTALTLGPGSTVLLLILCMYCEMLYNTVLCPIARCNTFLTFLNQTKPAETLRELIITYSIPLTGTLSRGRSYSRLSGVEYIADSTAHTLAASGRDDDDTVSDNEYSHYADSGADDEGDNSSVYHSSNEDVDSVNNSREYD